MKDASGEDVKMSKSLGNVLDPFEVMDKFGTDALRYYCFREVSFGQDGAVSTAGFESRYETELANDYGNLASRTIAMIARYRDGETPEAEPDAALAADFEGLAPRSSSCSTRPRSRRRSSGSGSGVRRLNRYVEEQAPWKLAKDPEQAGELDTVLRSLAEGLRVVTVLLHAYMPETTERLMGALGQDGGFAIEAARFGSAGRARSPAGPAAVPEARERMIDSHTHLDRSPGSDAELVAAAREAGLGASSRSARTRRPAARRSRRRGPPGGLRRGRPPPQRQHGLRRRGHRRAARARAPPEGARDRGDRARRLPRLRAARRPGARLLRPHAARARDRQAARHPPRAAEDDTIAMLDREAQGLEVILHCFSMPDRLDECLERGWWISFAGNVTYPKAQDLAEAAERAPLDRLLVETDAPYLTPQALRKQRNQPAYVVHTARFVAERRGIAYEELEAAVDANAARLFGW